MITINNIVTEETDEAEETMLRWTKWLCRHPFKVEKSVQSRYGVHK